MGKYKIKKENITEYVAGYDINDAKKRYKLRKIIKLASNENPYRVPWGLKQYLKKEIKNIYLYPDKEYKNTRNILAKKISLTSSQIILGNGSDDILELVFKAIIKPKDKILLFTPSFSFYKILAEIYNTKIIWIKLNNFKYNIKNILRKINPSIKLIIICNPNNPTGTYLNQEDMEKIINKCPQKTTLCIDEAYYNYTDADDFPDTVSLFVKYYKKKNIIVTRTFSKIYSMAGLRIGYAFSNSEFISLLDKIRIPFNLNILGEKAVKYVLKKDNLIEKYRQLNIKNRAFLYSQLNRLNLSYISTQTNFILIRIPISGQKIFNKLLKKGIIIRPFTDDNLKNYIRVTIGTYRENKQLIKELKKILK